jgi:hypothetical protein
MSVVSLVTSGSVGATQFGEAPNSSPWLGDLAELIVYDRALAADERRAVEDYLLAKYATTGTVTTPVVSPGGGVFTDAVTVSIRTATPAALIHYTLDGTEPTVHSSPYAGPFVLDATTTLKAKAFRADLAESATATVGFTRASDAVPMMPGLQLWLRADAGVPGVGGDFWEDQSGQNNHARQVDGAKMARLIPNVVNALPALHFDGGDGVVFTNRLADVETVFWVVRTTETATGVNARRSLLADAGTNTFLGGFGSPGSIWDAGSSSTQVRLGQTWLNGLLVPGTTTPRPQAMSVISLVTSGSVGAVQFGEAPNSSPWLGDLAELIVYDRALSTVEVRAVEDYLNAKYRFFVRLN